MGTCVKRRVGFGASMAVARDVNTGVPIGDAIMVNSFSFSDSAERIKNIAGDSPFAERLGEGERTTELTLSLNEIPKWLYPLVYNLTPIEVDGNTNTTGTIQDIENFKGTTGFDPVNGISAINISTAANLRVGSYTAIWETANTLSLYKTTAMGLDNGSANVLCFDDDQHLIDTYTITNNGASVATVTDSAGNSTDMGIEFVGGSAVNGTVGDSFTFEVVSPDYSMEKYKIKNSSKALPFYLTVVTSDKNSKNGFIRYDFFSVILNGVPVNLTAGEMSATELTGELQYNCCKNSVYDVTVYEPETSC